MSYGYTEFIDQVDLIKAQNAVSTTLQTELGAIITALGSDTTTHDTTIEAADATVAPGNVGNTYLTNDLLLLINRGKAGNLSTETMIAALSGATTPVTATKPGLLTNPSISGAAVPAVVGTVLTAGHGTWLGAPTSYTYQWTRDGADIGGATSATYTLVQADMGHEIRCVVTAANATGSTAAPASNMILTTAPPALLTAPSVSSNATPPIAGSVLTTTNGTWSGSPSSYTYVWTRDDAVIAGQTAKTKTVVTADLGTTVRCIVTAVGATGSVDAPAGNGVAVPA